MTISTSNLVAAPQRPDSNCQLCPRLANFRAEARARNPDWFNSPVESFGDPNGLKLDLYEHPHDFQLEPIDGLPFQKPDPVDYLTQSFDCHRGFP